MFLQASTTLVVPLAFPSHSVPIGNRVLQERSSRLGMHFLSFSTLPLPLPPLSSFIMARCTLFSLALVAVLLMARTADALKKGDGKL